MDVDTARNRWAKEENTMSPYIDADGSVTLVPSSLHNAGTGVEELGDLVLNTRDITRLDDLVDDRLVEWWAGVAGVPEPPC